MTDRELVRYEKALEFATKKHSGQIRKEGKPYITHPIAVAEILREEGYGIDYQITALFHDLLEDTDATEEEIVEYGNEHILKAVKLLTKPKGYVMETYLSGVKSDEMAFAVKKADKLHNLLSASNTDDAFKLKNINETYKYYMDFSDKIVEAVKKLEKEVNNNKKE